MSIEKLALDKRLEDIVAMRTVLHPRDWKDERQLMMKRWFDYRFLSPLQATLLFGELYIRGLRRYVRRHVDANLAETVSGIKEGAPANRAAWFTSLWRARQRTDEIFVPYDLLIDFSFDFSSRRKRRWSMLPNQLHASAKNEEAWWALFDEAVEDQLPVRMRRVGDMPVYRLENDKMLPPQRHFREIMIAEMRHENRSLADQITERVLAKRHLTIEEALGLAASASDRVETEARARSLFAGGSWEAAPLVNANPSDILPSCFGIAETMDVKSEPCASCPLASRCGEFAEMAIQETVRLSGYASPVLTADRARSRRNTAKSRSKGNTVTQVVAS